MPLRGTSLIRIPLGDIAKQRKEENIMGFERWGYQFDGAYISPNSLQARSGVYVILFGAKAEITGLYLMSEKLLM